MAKLLTREGKSILQTKIATAQDKLKVIMSQKNDAYENGGNGWHDNFSFEQLIREEAMIAGELASLTEILQTARIVPSLPASDTEVDIGCIVTLEDENGVQVEYVVVGFGEGNTSSRPMRLEYLAPLINPFMGGSVGDEHALRIGGKKIIYTITHIRRA